MTYMLKIGKTFYARIVVPLDLQSHFRNKEFKKSLKTKDRKLAKQLLIKVLHEWQQHFFQLRYSKPMEQRPPSQEALKIFAKKYPDISPEPKIFIDVLGLEKTFWPVELMHIQDVLDLKNPPVTEPTVINNYYRTINVPVEQAEQAEQTTMQPVRSTPSTPRTPKALKMTFQQAADAWLKSAQVLNTSGKDRSTQDAYKRRVEKMTKAFGSRTLAEINCNKFLDNYFNAELVHLTAVYRKALLTVACQVINYQHDQTDKQVRSAPNIKIIRTAEQRLYKRQNPANAPYTPQALQTLFDSYATNPVKRMTTPDDRNIHLTTIYATLLALYTGHRTEDLRHLLASDFKLDADIPNITQECRLVTETSPSGEVKVLGVTNKTYNSLTLPIHQHLIDLGLPEFIRSFDHRRQPFTGASTIKQRLSAQLTHAGIKQKGQLAHALRKTMCNKYESNGTPINISEMLMNHSIKGVRGSYALPDFISEHEIVKINTYVQKLDFGIDYTALHSHLREHLPLYLEGK